MNGQTIRLEDEPIGKSGFTADGFAWRGHMALPVETCGSGYRDAADCGRRYLDIKNKRRWGYTKTGAPVSCELRSVIARKLRMAGCEAGP